MTSSGIRDTARREDQADATLQAFEACTLPPANFSHHCHLSLGWTYLQRYGFPEGVVKFRERLKAYVSSVGAAGVRAAAAATDLTKLRAKPQAMRAGRLRLAAS